MTSDATLRLQLATSTGRERLSLLDQLWQYNFLYNPTQAKDFCLEIIKLADQFADEYWAIRGQITLGTCEFGLGNFNAYKEAIFTARSLSSDTSYNDLSAALMTQEGRLLYMEGNIDEAHKCLRVAKAAFLETGSATFFLQQALFSTNMYLGLCWLKLQEPVRSLTFFKQCYELSAKISSERLSQTYQAMSASTMGRTYLSVNDFVTARQWIRKGLQILTKQSENAEAPAAISSLLYAESYVREGDWIQAEGALKETEAYFRLTKNSNPAHWLYWQHFYAIVLRQIGRLAEAATSIELARQKWQELGSRLLEEEILLETALIKLAQGDTNEAQGNCASVLRLTQKSGNKLIARATHKALGEIYEVKGDWKKALLHAKQANELELEERKNIYSNTVRLWENRYEDIQRIKDAEIFRLRNIELAEKNDELTKLNKENQSLLEKRTDLMRIAVHDLRNPISTIQAQTYVLKQTIEQEPVTKLQKRLQVIERASNHMESLLNRLLSSERIEEGDFDLTITQINSVELLNTLVSEFTDVASTKGVTVQNRSQAKECPIATDELLLHQILANLLSNAIKYSPRDTTIALNCFRDQETMELTVADMGQGLTEDDMEQMFTSFGRLSATTTAGEKSTGLGLHLAQKLAGVIKGTITAESAGRHKGSIFTVKIPLALELVED